MENIKLEIVESIPDDVQTDPLLNALNEITDNNALKIEAGSRREAGIYERRVRGYARRGLIKFKPFITLRGGEYGHGTCFVYVIKRN